jgi:hypothetical protein
MTEPTARELVDLNVLPSPNSRLDARAKSAWSRCDFGKYHPLWLMLAGASRFVSAGIALLSSGRW